MDVYLQAHKILEIAASHLKILELSAIIFRAGQNSQRALDGLWTLINWAFLVSGYQPDAGFESISFNEMQPLPVPRSVEHGSVPRY